MKYDICIVGGCGRVGLPLGMAFAKQGKRVVLFDIAAEKVEKVNAGNMPFKEHGADKLLRGLVDNGNFVATTEITVLSDSRVIIVVIGTPIDNHLNARQDEILTVINNLKKYLRGDQLLILRSTLYPGLTKRVYESLRQDKKLVKVAYCPERITEGYSLAELRQLPQIVAGCSEAASKEAAELFSLLTKKVIHIEPMEAELAKLMTNTWRYVNFGISNYFYMIASSRGLDFYNIHSAMIEDYPRLKSFARAGFAAGPCLLKDTMQLADFDNNRSMLGHIAMMINEGMPNYIVSSVKSKYDLSNATVGLLGMSFKADIDDIRESLSYKLRRILELEAKRVLCHDANIDDPSFVTMEEIRDKADIIVLATPHREYRHEDWGNKILIDVWNYYEKGGLL